MTEEQKEDENSVGMCYQAERTCANCREWFINNLGERDCLQTSCEDYSDWVERPESSEITEEQTCLDCKHCNQCYKQRHQGSNKACDDIEPVEW